MPGPSEAGAARGTGPVPASPGARRLLGVGAAVGLLAACNVGGSSSVDDGDQAAAACRPGACIVVDVAVSSEKLDLVSQLGRDFNATGFEVDGRKVVVRPKEKASRVAADQLLASWPDDPDDPRPVIWSPPSSAWGTIVDERRAAAGARPIAGRGEPLLNSPLVLALPKPQAEALGYPGSPVGWSDVHTLAREPGGWTDRRHPEWGSFKLAKANPYFSSSGLDALVAQTYAAAGKTGGLTPADLDDPAVVDANRSVESSVVHYGDTALGFLDNWYRADQRGNPYGYASAVAVEEKSVIDYNRGDPDGVLEPGEQPRRPRVPLVAVYPAEGTLSSDSPLYVLDADWVTVPQRKGAQAFVDFVRAPDRQRTVVEAGYRPGNPEVAIGGPVTRDNGVDPDLPRTTMALPAGPALVALLDRWDRDRKGAQVLLVIDVSGSMAEDIGNGRTKLELAKQAMEASLARFRPDDRVGLREFSTGLGPQQDRLFLDPVPLGPLADRQEALHREIAGLAPANGTPLFTVVRQAMQELAATYDPTRINAVVLLTDGKNEDGDTTDDNRQRTELVRYLQSLAQGENARPVRLFTIGYGTGADTSTLEQLAEAANGRYYGATADPTTITKVFAEAISNF